MQQTLTIGQMIDTLKPGQIAQGKYGEVTVHVKRNLFKSIFVCDEEGNIGEHDNFFKITGDYMEYEWTLIPKFVSFGEAMDALSKGKVITYHDDSPDKYTFDLKKDWTLEELNGYRFDDLLKSRWTIGE